MVMHNNTYIKHVKRDIEKLKEALAHKEALLEFLTMKAKCECDETDCLTGKVPEREGLENIKKARN